MSITISQIRGARGILNWSQQDLAQRTGISATSIGSIENGVTTPRASTLETIRSTFERNDIEFLGLDGVRRKDSNINIYEGTEGIQSFFDDVYETVKRSGGDICLFNGVPKKLIQWLGEDFYKMHIARMNEIKENFTFRIIVEQDELMFIANAFAQYRWFPKEKFNDKTIYCYGNNLAFMNFSKDNVRVVVIKQADIAESFRTLFDIAWENVAMVPDSVKKSVSN